MYRAGSRIANGEKRQFKIKLRIEKNKKWLSFKMAELKDRLALIQNNSRRRTVYHNEVRRQVRLHNTSFVYISGTKVWIVAILSTEIRSSAIFDYILRHLFTS